MKRLLGAIAAIGFLATGAAAQSTFAREQVEFGGWTGSAIDGVISRGGSSGSTSPTRRQGTS